MKKAFQEMKCFTDYRLGIVLTAPKCEVFEIELGNPRARLVKQIDVHS